jgi:hypothetical protein
MSIVNAKNMQLSRSFLIPPDDVKLKILKIESNVYTSIYALTALIGYLSFLIFGSTGFSLFGGEMIKKFLFKPKIPTPEEHVLGKVVLKELSKEIIKKSRIVYSIKEDLDCNKHRMTQIEKITKKKIMKQKINEIKIESEELKEMLEILNKEANFENENPLVYLSFGVIGIIIYSIGIFFALNNYYLLNDSLYFVEGMYYFVRSTFGMGFTFVLLLIIYLSTFFASWTGKNFIGSQLPNWILGKNELAEDKTWSDSFLANSNYFLLFSIGTVVGMVRQMPTVFADTGFFYWFYLDFSSVIPYHFFFIDIVPNAVFIIFYLVGFFIVFFKLSPKEKLVRLIKEKKNDLKEKQEMMNQNNGLI